MTTESGSDSESKDQDQEQKETSGKQEKATQEQQPQQVKEEHQNALEQFPSVAAHSTPVKKEQATEKELEVAAAVAKQLEYQQFEDDKLSQKSSSSKLSRSPLRIVKKPKTMQCKVILLDGSEYGCEVEKRSKGHILFDKVCEHLNLLEKDYFGLTYRDMENQKNWLDPAKEIKKQIRSGAWYFSFNVKFYPPDPAQLSEDITRYYLCLQLRDDIVSGRLPCSFVTLALLGSYTVQSELGDYDPDEYGSSDYVSEFRFAPNHTKELEDKVIELHKSHRGMTPAEAEMHFLENAKKLSMYGVDLHHAKDSEGVEIMLGVCASGLLIYRDRLRINRFAWPKVLKISYKRNNFYIKIRPGEFEQFESTIGFKLPNHRAAKRLWKVCVEHHTFFRLLLPEAPPKKFLTLGSKFRYSGRTQAQTRRASALIDRPAPYFERSSSKRYTMSRSLDGASVNENHEMYMKDSMSAAEVGTGQYTTTKGISQTNLITTVTPEKKAEEEKDDEQIKKKEEEGTPVSAIRHDTKTDSERTDTAADGETTATESDQEEDGDLKAQELDKTQEDLIKHQTNISELKRTFLETTTDTSGTSEWEKRLSTSPVRLAARHEEAPMIEPLVPDETKEDKEKSEKRIFLQKESTTHLDSQGTEDWVIVDKVPIEVVDGESKTIVTYKLMTVSSKTGDIPPELLKHSITDIQSFEDLEGELLSKDDDKQKMYTLGKSYDTVSGKIVTMTTKVKEGEKMVLPSFQSTEMAMPESVKVVPAVAEYEILEPITDEKARRLSDAKRRVSESLTPIKEADSRLQSPEEENVKKILKADEDLQLPEMVGWVQTAKAEKSLEKEQQKGGETFGWKTKPERKHGRQPPFTIATAHYVTESSASKVVTKQLSDEKTLDGSGIFTLIESARKPTEFIGGVTTTSHSWAQSPIVKTEAVSFGSATGAEKLEISMKEVPVVHTETKTITYESSEVDSSADSEPGVLMSAQTITSETTSTTTTTHITKTVKGGISETRIEKRIVITGDADIDHDQALAQAIKEAKEQHPDMSVTKVVVHKETEITPEDGED
ncbi:band 4.1-like protein 3 isoform 4-T9 [Vipera latastei]